MLVPDSPQRHTHAGQTGSERDPVGRTVALQAVGAVALAVGEDGGVVVVDRSLCIISVFLLDIWARLERGTVEEIEDVSGNDGCEDHAAPVLR